MCQGSYSSPPVTVASEPVDSIPVITISGELDIATVPAIRGHLHAVTDNAKGPRLIIEMSGVSFCGSAGVAELLATRERVAARGADVVLVGCQPVVLRVLTLAGVQRLFRHADTVAEATLCVTC